MYAGSLGGCGVEGNVTGNCRLNTVKYSVCKGIARELRQKTKFFPDAYLWNEMEKKKNTQNSCTEA